MKHNPYQEGYKAGSSCDNQTNPYIDAYSRREWQDGFADAQDDQEYIIVDGVKILLGKE